MSCYFTLLFTNIEQPALGKKLNGLTVNNISVRSRYEIAVLFRLETSCNFAYGLFVDRFPETRCTSAFRDAM
jgi:hypothetical protein